MGRVIPSPPVPDSRERHGQVLLLSRTMLSNHELPYVGRFACDWLRLATTDPHVAHRVQCTSRLSEFQGRKSRVHEVVMSPSHKDNGRSA